MVESLCLNPDCQPWSASQPCSDMYIIFYTSSPFNKWTRCVENNIQEHETGERRKLTWKQEHETRERRKWTLNQEHKTRERRK